VQEVRLGSEPDSHGYRSKPVSGATERRIQNVGSVRAEFMRDGISDGASARFILGVKHGF